MKFWDILPFSHIQDLAKHLDIVFGNFTVDQKNRCKNKCVNRDTVVPMRWPVVFNITANRETLTSTYGETVKAVKSIRHCPDLTLPKIRSKKIVNQKGRLFWKLKAGDGVKDFSTCLAADPVEFLSKPLSSPSLTDKPATSTSTDM